MSTAKDLRDIFEAGRPLLEQALELGEQLAALRDAATVKGLDWSQIKALLKAQIQDEHDGKHRVGRLIEKADFAQAYAEMLGLGGAKMNEEKNTRSSSNDPTVTVTSGDKSAEMKLSTLGRIANASKTETGRKVLKAALAAVTPPDDGLDIPDYLRRTRAAS